MKQDSKTILIENPHTGNVSFGDALKLTNVEKVAKYATPDEARRHFPEWDKMIKVVLIRDPLERFESAATAYLLGRDSVGDRVEDEVLSQSLTPEKRGEVLLRRLLEGWEGQPLGLMPQCHWLTCKMDLVLATHDIATFFNAIDDPSQAVRGNTFSHNPEVRDFWVRARSEENRAMVRAVYAKDYERFSSLPVWSPDITKVRFLTGYCPDCPPKGENLQDRAKSEEPIRGKKRN